MYLKKYTEILKRLRNDPMINPSAGDIAKLCPHLAAEEIERMFNQSDTMFIACPSLKVRGAFQIIYLEPAAKNQPVTLRWGHTGKINYAPEYPYTAEAIKFAEDNWGKYLIDDSWSEVAEVRIMDPTDLVYGELYPGGAPKNVMTIIAIMSQRSEVMSRDHSRPRNKLFDEAIIEMSTDPLISEELKDGRHPYTYYFCGFCGSGFEPSYCPGCDNGFEGGYFEDRASRMALPPKLAEFARQNGHVFKKDPKIALEKELKGFRENKYYYWRK
ncbi:MAG: hypothetical protein WC788_00045 [Candidatus Paceibacterota bacterium]